MDESNGKPLGQYHWVHCLAPASYQSTASWFTGWISIGGQLVFSASAAFAAGLQFQALITLNHPDSYTPIRWQGMMFYWLILAYSTALNIWGSKILPHTNTAAGEQQAFPQDIPSELTITRDLARGWVCRNRCRSRSTTFQALCELCVYQIFQYKWVEQ